MKWSITTAAENGIFLLNTFTGYHVPGTDPVLEKYRVVDCYREVMPLAERMNVKCAIENHSSVCPDADGLMSLIAMVGSPNLGTNPDISNFVPEFSRRSEPALQAMYPETERITPLVMNAHLKIDTFTDKGEHPHVDIPRYLSILRKHGYDGHMVLEYYGSGDCAASSVQGVQLLKRLI
jgi:sugar phosphate isomerase/epimerase